MIDPSSRHSRHELFRDIGVAGQEKLERSRVAIVGCGALGSRIAELIGRAGVSRRGGIVTIIDRDTVDASNLQRQALFTDDDARRSIPKAEAARRHLLAIDGELQVVPHVRDFNAANARRFVADHDLVFDGTDNFQTRFVINDAALAENVPWIYGGAVGSEGVVAMIAPTSTPCFRCYVETLPPAGVADTCDTAGIITPLAAFVASLQVAIGLRFLVEGTITRGMTFFDLWKKPGEMRRTFEHASSLADCASCAQRLFPALDATRETLVTLCGRNSVQISSRDSSGDLDAAEERLRPFGAVHRHDESITASIPEGRLTLFRDGRIVVEGTVDPHEAKTIASRYLA